MNEKARLMRKIKEYDFALKELNLYLDTHPNCRRALALFKKYKDLRKKLSMNISRISARLPPNKATTISIGHGSKIRGLGKGDNLCGSMRKNYSIP